MKKTYIECGKVCSAHGVRGLMKVESWCDSPKVLASMKRVFLADVSGKYKETAVKSASVSNDMVLMSIEGIESREAAQAMKGTLLYLHRDDIPVPNGAMLLADMIGLPVVDVDTGTIYGEISDITDAVRGKLYSVKTENGEVLLPDVPEFIKEIDGERGMFIRPIPGFFD